MAKQLNFSTIKENFNEYQLADGTTLNVSAVLKDVFEIVGKKTRAGNPIYHTDFKIFIAPATTWGVVRHKKTKTLILAGK